jgi:NADH dehydrogenase FAD-containing subunit
MTQAGPPVRRPRAVLLGAGHAHLYALKRAAAFARRGFELAVVAPEVFWYSGLATGVLGGHYPPELDQVDVARLAERGGGRFVQDRAVRIDPQAQTVHLEAGAPLPYDVLSLNLGSEVPIATVPGAARHGYPVKPIRNLWRLRQDLEARWQAGGAVRVVVAGGGPTGCEVAANVASLARARGGSAAVTLLARGDRILEGLPERASAKVSASLTRRGVTILSRASLAGVEDGVALTEDGRRVPFDRIVYALGLKPPPLVRETGLPVDGDGALLVDEHLRSVGDARVFGGGDCVAYRERPLAKVGVYAIREAPVLYHNLLATLEGRPLRRFRPQRRFLLILNLGDGTGLATWGGLHWQGRIAFLLKDRIDRMFLREYRA